MFRLTLPQAPANRTQQSTQQGAALAARPPAVVVDLTKSAFQGLHESNLSALGLAATPRFCNVQVDGENMVAAPRVVWQTALYKVFVVNNRGAMVLPKVAAWLAAKFGKADRTYGNGDPFFSAVAQLFDAWAAAGLVVNTKDEYGRVQRGTFVPVRRSH